MKTYLSKALEFGRSLITPGLDTLIVFVTSRCNCRCEHCFYWQQLGNPAELTIEEIESLSLTAGQVRSLMISGGEPFLREDLPEIATLFTSNAGAQIFSVPTNGILTKSILTQVETMCQRSPSTLFKINLSLDAFEEVHDKMRGSRGVFKLAIGTLKKLIRLKSKIFNLEVNVSTVVCRENIEQIEAFGKFVQSMKVDQHNIEIIRGEAKQPSLNQERKALIHSFLDLCWRVDANPHYKTSGMSKWAALSMQRVGDLLERANRFHQAWLKSEYLRRNKGWGIRCRAGENICVVEPNGELRACELRPPVCNLKDFDFDLRRALASNTLSNERNRIKTERCSCTHGCFLSVSCRLSPAQVLLRAPIFYLKKRKASHGSY